jgi:bacterioferritin
MNSKEKQALVDMLNKDLADEHISVIRYLIHAYQAGEDTPLGAMLLSMAREEMWHVDWLGDVIGELGVEPNMVPGVYPHDPTSNASLLRSYIAWEENLVALYAEQAEHVDDPEIKRVLMQQSVESAIHKERFAEMLEKLGPEGEEPLAYEETGAFSPAMLGRLQGEMSEEYKLVLQHLRHAFVFEDEEAVSGKLELTAMRHMKHLSHFAEELAESGREPQFTPPALDMSGDIESALQADVKLTQEARDRFVQLSQDAELAEHRGLKIEVDHMVNQEAFLEATVEELLEGVQASEPEQPPAEPESGPEEGPGDEFTVGSLLEK